MAPKIIFVVIAYLLGSIPFGYLFVKYVFTSGEDVREIGSGGIGATNVTRRAGVKGGLLTYVFDVAKGVAAVMLMRIVADDDYFWIGAAAIAAIVGHIFPIFLGFRGGKGVATGVGVYLALGPVFGSHNSGSLGGYCVLHPLCVAGIDHRYRRGPALDAALLWMAPTQPAFESIGDHRHRRMRADRGHAPRKHQPADSRNRKQDGCASQTRRPRGRLR